MRLIRIVQVDSCYVLTERDHSNYIKEKRIEASLLLPVTRIEK